MQQYGAFLVAPPCRYSGYQDGLFIKREGYVRTAIAAQHMYQFGFELALASAPAEAYVNIAAQAALLLPPELRYRMQLLVSFSSSCSTRAVLARHAAGPPCCWRGMMLAGAACSCLARAQQWPHPAC